MCQLIDILISVLLFSHIYNRFVVALPTRTKWPPPTILPLLFHFINHHHFTAPRSHNFHLSSSSTTAHANLFLFLNIVFGSKSFLFWLENSVGTEQIYVIHENRDLFIIINIFLATNAHLTAVVKVILHKVKIQQNTEVR